MTVLSGTAHGTVSDPSPLLLRQTADSIDCAAPASVLRGEQFEVRGNETTAANLAGNARLSHDAAQSIRGVPVAQVVAFDAVDVVRTPTEFHGKVAIFALHAEQAFAAGDRHDGGLIDAGGGCAGGPGADSASEKPRVRPVWSIRTRRGSGGGVNS